MQRNRPSWLARSAGLALTVCILGSNALADPTGKPWDQKEVTAVAAKLAKALKDLHLTVKQSPEAQLGSTQRRAQYQAREDLKLLVTVSQRLASQLQAGDDKDATLPTYKRLQLIRREAEEHGRKANIPAPSLEKVVSARAQLDQLEPFYEDAAPADAAAAPAPMQ